ncbi:MAG: transposase [Alphaproteobacteria bacterium]|nr:MAG: transposase [Alphaproteobacteria bacterium]
MGRQRRRTVAGYPYHLIQRGNNRQDIFFSDEDRIFYLDQLKKFCDRCGCRLHAYVLMTNHVHLLISPDADDGIQPFMQGVGTNYVRYINRKQSRSGSLFEGRYRASLIETEAYLIACYRYVELNPVRAGMVDVPGAYPWSSYLINSTTATSDLIVPHPYFKSLGPRAYRALCQEPLGVVMEDEITQSLLRSRPLGGQGPGRGAHGGDRRSRRFKDGQGAIA